MQNDLLTYPRRVFRRKIIRKIGRFAIRLLTKITIEGKENFPQNGPYIMAGNHVSAMEVLLMALFSPHQVEILGAGDIPLDPNLAPFAQLHGFIPINRGSVDQKALNHAVNILNMGGVVGIFPEGGIWSWNIKQAKIGVSWICQRSKAPVLPIAFIGMQGSLTQMLRFKKPVIKLRVGKILSYDFLFNDLSEKTKKEQLQDAADKVMCAIKNLLPPQEKIETGADGVSLEPLWYHYYIGTEKYNFEFENKEALSMVIRHPVIMDVFTRNLKLPMKALTGFNKKVNIKMMVVSITSICDYLNENPGFLIYRFGTDLGRAMENGLRNYLVELNKLKMAGKIQVQISENA